MFELKNPENPTVAFTFDTPQVIIGTQGNLILPEINLTPVHLEINWVNNCYLIENKAHDPLCSINSRAFWKKQLRNGDILKIGNYKLVFNYLSPCATESVPIVATNSLVIYTADELQQKSQTPPQQTQEAHISDVSVPIHKKSNPIPQAPTSRWHLFVLAFSCLFLFVVLFSTSFYITVTEKTEVEKILAARGIADISMILNYMKNESIKPPFKNRLDPVFLKEIGEKLIPKDLTKYEWIDSEGHFIGASYILRLYSDADFSRFLLIAQPQANFAQSVIPKATLVVDSDNMMIKEFWKVRDLNRLLVSTSGFEGIIQTEIGELIQQAESISIESLSKTREKLGFKPPEELAMLDPKATYYIYNAPRYFLLHEKIVDLADSLARKPDSHLKESLDRHLKSLESNSSQVLYSSKGIEAVIGARKVFSKKSLQPKLLLGYLQMTPDGKIESSHLLMPNQKSWPIGSYSPHSLIKEDILTAVAPKDLKSPHSLNQEVQALLKSRKEKLKTLALSLITSIENHLDQADTLFFTHFNSLFDRYKENSKEAQDTLDLSLKRLFEKHVLTDKTLSLSQFLSILDDHRVDLGFERDPELFSCFYDSTVEIESHLKDLFGMIEETDSLEILDSLILVAHDLLNQDMKELPAKDSWKKQFKMQCIRKLETILWQPESVELDLNSSDLQWKIARILKNGYINDSEGRNFYLSHFLEEIE